MAGTIIADYIRTDANKLSLNVGNTTFATINAMGLLSNTGVQIISPTGTINAASIAAGSIPGSALSTSANTIPRTSMTTGAILQAITATKTDTFSTTTSGSFVDVTGLSVTITPTTSSSRFLILVNIGVIHTWNAGRDRSSAFKIMRNGSDTGIGDASGSHQRAMFRAGSNNTDGNHGYGASFSYLDSPATTSAITYKLVAEAEDGATLYINRTVADTDINDAYGSRVISTFTVLEIA